VVALLRGAGASKYRKEEPCAERPALKSRHAPVPLCRQPATHWTTHPRLVLTVQVGKRIFVATTSPPGQTYGRPEMESEESSGEGSSGYAPLHHVIPNSATHQVECSAGELPYLASWIPGEIATAEVGDPRETDEGGNLDELLEWLTHGEAGDGEAGQSQSAASESRLGSLEPETSTINGATAAAAAAAAAATPVESASLPGCLEMENAVVLLPGREKAVGTCHKCGATLAGNKPSARCTGCGTGFHISDCGSRLAKSGLDLSLLAQCPRCACVCQCSGGDVPCHAHAMKKRRREKLPAATSAAVPIVASHVTRAAIPATSAPMEDDDAADATREELLQLRAENEELRHVRAENVSLRAALRDALKVVDSLLCGGGGNSISGSNKETDAKAGQREGEVGEGPVALMEGAERNLRGLLTRQALKDALTMTYLYITVSLISSTFHTLNVKEREMLPKVKQGETQGKDEESFEGHRTNPIDYAVGPIAEVILAFWVIFLHIAARHAVGRQDASPPAHDFLRPVTVLMIVTAIFGVILMFMVGLVFVDGTDRAWVQERYGTNDDTNIIRIALMELCLLGLQVMFVTVAARRTLYLRARVALYRRLCAAQAVAWWSPDIPQEDRDGAMTNHAWAREKDEELEGAYRLPPV